MRNPTPTPAAPRLYKTSLECTGQLDRVFVHLRNASQDEGLEKICRLHLLEVIELRAGRWVSPDQVANYYPAKLAELVPHPLYIATNRGNLNVGKCLRLLESI